MKLRGDRVVVVGVWCCHNNNGPTTPQHCADRRCHVVVCDVGARLHIFDAHAMRKVQPILMQMHDA